MRMQAQQRAQGFTGLLHGRYVAQHFGVQHVAHGFGTNFDGVVDGNAGHEQRAQRAAKQSQVEVARKQLADRQAQQQPMRQRSGRLGAQQERQDQHEKRDTDENKQGVVGQESGNGNNAARRGRQFRFETGKQLGDFWQHKQRKQEHDRKRGRNDHGRIKQGVADFHADFIGLVLLVGQIAQTLLQAAAALGGGNDADIQAVKNTRKFGHAFSQSLAGLDALVDFIEDAPQARAGRLFGQNGKRLVQGQARLDHDGKVARKHDLVLMRHAADAGPQELHEGPPAISGNFFDDEPARLQALFHHSLIGRNDDILDQQPFGRKRGVFKSHSVFVFAVS